MVSVKEALIDSAETLGPIRNHEHMEAVAGMMVGKNAIRKDKAIRLKTAVKLAMLHAKVGQANAYRIFAERPGFVVFRNADDDKVVYYEWEELQELVRAQDAEYYPKNFGALTSSVQAEFKPEPEWDAGDAYRGDVLMVPLLNSSTMPKARDFVVEMLGDKADKIDVLKARTLVSALSTMLKNGNFK